MSTYTICLDARFDLNEGGHEVSDTMAEAFEKRFMAEAQALAEERAATVEVLLPGDRDYMSTRMSDDDCEFWQAVHDRIGYTEIEEMDL